MSSSPGVPDRGGHKESQIIDILGAFVSVGGTQLMFGGTQTQKGWEPLL
jgi:hypothetical protein